MSPTVAPAWRPQSWGPSRSALFFGPAKAAGIVADIAATACSRLQQTVDENCLHTASVLDAPIHTHYMRFLSRICRATLAILFLSHLASRASAAQEPRSGGYDFTFGSGTSTGEGYKNRSGNLSSLEVFFSTRMDGTNTPLLMGAQIAYFAQDDPTDGGACVFVPKVNGCARNLPDMAMAGLLVAYEPVFATYNFVHLVAGGSFLQPSSDGGPTLAGHAGAKIGRSFGQHLAVHAGGRILVVPDLRGFAVTLTTWSVGLRLR